jgi:LemA protein
MIIIPIILVLILIYFWSLYNQFVTIKTRIKASIQEIGNQLKRQAELIPNLTASVKGYMKHEKDIFKELTEARKAVSQVVDSGDTKKMIEAGDRMQAALAPIRAVFESTPQLQAAGPTTQLMNELTDTADKVMYSRRTLIDLTADYNIKVAVFPSNLVANMFGFKPEPGLEMADSGSSLKVSADQTQTPKVEL